MEKICIYITFSHLADAFIQSNLQMLVMLLCNNNVNTMRFCEIKNLHKLQENNIDDTHTHTHTHIYIYISAVNRLKNVIVLITVMDCD